MQNTQGERHLIISQEELANLIAVMPRAMVESDAIKGTLVALTLKEHLRANQLGLIYREDRPLTRVAQIFVTLTRRAAAHLVKDGA
jgi:DNA-binding transcriptional LysR family regulator